MVKIEVNGYPVEVVAGATVIQACQKVGFTLPRYCYDERLLIAGNCRMCLVEVFGSPKPQVACALPVSPNMKVFTDSPRAKKARELVTDFLLIHHPLDCPICDQGGECDLQDQTFAFGSDRSRYYHAPKRGVEDKDFGPIVATAMTRCIHCTRCVRYMSETAGVPVLGTISRGSHTEIGTYMDGVKLESELAGNVADLCPVGALTSKPTSNMYRPWELETLKTVDVTDPARYDVTAQVTKNVVHRMLPVKDALTNGYMHDKGRYAFDSLTGDNRLYHPAQVRKHKNQYGVGAELTWERAFGILEDARGYPVADRLSSRFANPLTMANVEGSYEDAPVKNELVSGARRLDVLLGPWASVEMVTYWALVRSKLEEWGMGHTMKLEMLSSPLSPSTGHGVANLEDGMFDFRGVREADMVIVVGMDLRAEAPLVNMTLRDKFLRNDAKVFVVGGNSDLTYPVLQAGLSVSGLLDLMDRDHPMSKDIYGCKRPMILVSGSVLRRPDGAAMMDVLRMWAEMMKAGQRSYVADSVHSAFPSSWKVLNVHHRSGAAFAGHQLGIAPFSGFEHAGSSTRSMLRMVGLDRGDLVEGRWGIPNPKGYVSVVSMLPFLDMTLLGKIKRALPLSTHREEQSHLMGLDGVVRTSYAADMSAGDSMSFKSFQLVLDAFFPDKSFFFKSMRDTSFDRVVAELSYLDLPCTGKERVSSVSGVEEKVVGLLDVPVEPVLNNYYVEGSRFARHSRTMFDCYEEYEEDFDFALVDKEFVQDLQEGWWTPRMGSLARLFDTFVGEWEVSDELGSDLVSSEVGGYASKGVDSDEDNNEMKTSRVAG